LQARWANVPVGVSIGLVACGSEFSAIIYKLNDSFGSAIIQTYGEALYHYVLNNGVVSYYAINQVIGS